MRLSGAGLHDGQVKRAGEDLGGGQCIPGRGQGRGQREEPMDSSRT